MPTSSSPVEARIEAFARQRIADGHGLIESGQRILYILALCQTDDEPSVIDERLGPPSVGRVAE
jgi:hypothetical protein